MSESELNDYQYDGEYPWRDEAVLHELHHEEELTHQEIADLFDCGRATVSKWISKLEVEPPEKTHPWRDEDVLVELYHEKGLTLEQVARELEVDWKTVFNWMDHHGIERRSHGESKRMSSLRKPAPFHTDKEGYELWRFNYDGVSHPIGVHRLLAVAEYGFEAVRGKYIHHRNEVPWDNRPENIVPMDPRDHQHHHHQTLSEEDAEEIYRRYQEEDIKQQVLADEYGVAKSIVSRVTRRGSGYSDG